MARGGWAAAWDTTGKDPCGWIESNSDPGGTVERAGMFDAKGMNRVVARCGGAVYLYEGWGTGPLDAIMKDHLGAAGDGLEPPQSGWFN